MSENLIEDWRIEELCRQEFPGYAPYLYKLRRVLIVDLALRRAINNWDDLPDGDKIMTIVGAYIRAPTILDDFPELRDWTDLQDRNIYRYLRHFLGRPPVTERDVEMMARRVLHLIDDYRNLSLDYLSKNNKITMETLKRVRAQEQANMVDGGLKGQHDPLVRRRFSLGDLAAAQVCDDSVRLGSNDYTIDRMRELDRESVHAESATGLPDTKLPEQKIPEEMRGRIAVVRFPCHESGKRTYEMALQKVRGDIARLKYAFRVEEGGKGSKANRSSGKLDRRRLFRAPFDPAVFSQTTHEEPGKALVAVLLDASGSMAEGNRYKRAVEVGAMFNEAFINHPHITLHTYSHTSTEMTDQCELSYHGQASVRARESIGSIEPKISNYDYQAIWGVVAHLSAESAGYARRILISVSDGRPCVPNCVNSTGVEATRKAVESIRRQGWTIFGVGIGAYHAEYVYGQRWTVNVSQIGSLPSNMSSLLVRLMRR